MQKLLNNRLLIIFIGFILAFFPNALSKKSMSNNNAIVIAVGVDKKDEEYTLSFQVVIPKQDNSFRESLLVLSASGDNLYDIYKKAETQIGKRIAFRHCQYIVVNEEVAKTEDMTLLLDFLVRNRDVSNSCIMLCTDKTAKDIMNADSKTESSINIGIIELLEYYERKYFIHDTNLENFVTGAYSPRKCGLMTFISLTDKIEEGIGLSAQGDSTGSSSQGGSSQSGSSGGGEDKKQEYISFDGKVAVFKDAKYKGLFLPDELLNLNWFNSKSGFSDKFTIEGITDELYTDAKIGFELLEKRSKLKAYFEGDKPILSLDVDCKIMIEDVENAVQDKTVLQSGKYALTANLKSKIEQKIYNDCFSVFNKMKEYECDVIDVYSKFNKYNYDEFQQYLGSLDVQKFYLSNIKLVVNCNVET